MGYDSFSADRTEILDSARTSGRFDLCEGDLLDLAKVKTAMAGADVVFHFAANADVRHGPEHTRKDLERNTIGTANVIEAMKEPGVHRIAFASTGLVVVLVPAAPAISQTVAAGPGNPLPLW